MISNSKEKRTCQQTSSPCSRSARCPGTAKAPSWPTTPAPGTRPGTLAGLDWDPVTTEVYAVTGINPDGTGHYEPIAGWKSITRSDTGAVLSLNRDTYTVIDHGEMGEIVEAVLAQPNVKWETAGVLDGGKAVWCLALLDEPITLPGDDIADPAVPGHHQPARRHRRLRAARHRRPDRLRQHLPRRRTRRRAHRHHLLLHPQSQLAQPHRGSPQGRHRRPGRDAPLHRTGHANCWPSPSAPRQRELFITEFIPKPPEGLITDRVARNVDEARAALRLIFDSTTTEQVAATAYGLVQAAGEYLDHVRTARSWETRLNRTLIRPEPLKHRALSLAREVITA